MVYTEPPHGSVAEVRPGAQRDRSLPSANRDDWCHLGGLLGACVMCVPGRPISAGHGVRRLTGQRKGRLVSAGLPEDHSKPRKPFGVIVGASAWSPCDQVLRGYYLWYPALPGSAGTLAH